MLKLKLLITGILFLLMTGCLLEKEIEMLSPEWIDSSGSEAEVRLQDLSALIKVNRYATAVDTEDDLQLVLFDLEIVNQSNNYFPCSSSFFTIGIGESDFTQAEYLPNNLLIEDLPVKEIYINESCQGVIAFWLPIDSDTSDIALEFNGYYREATKYRIDFN